MVKQLIIQLPIYNIHLLQTTTFLTIAYSSLKIVSGKNRFKKIPISFNSKSFWLKIPLDYITTLGEFNLVQIDNPHINFLRFWVLKNDSIVQTSKLTGDNTIFSTRPLPSTSFVMELNNYKNGYLIIAADKKFTKLDLPIQFNTYSNFLNNRFEKNLSIGLFVGILILLCGINAALYIAVKESIYLWYCFYLFVISCYVFINEGILFKILYPNTPFLNDVIKYLVLSFYLQFHCLFFLTNY
jgi:hypothetical protein